MTRKRISPLPDTPNDASPALRRWLESAKEALEVRLGRRGDPGEAGVTFNDLVDAGIIQGIGRINPLTGLPQIAPGPGSGGEEQPTYPTPPAPANFVALGVFGGIHLLWDWVAHQYGIVLTEVRRSVDADLDNSSLIGVSGGSTYFDIIPGNQSETFWYWIRHVNANGRFGPWSQAIEATKPEDAATIIERITGQIDESHLADSLADEIERIGQIDAALVTERLARIDAIQAEATARVSGLQTEADARVSGLQAEANARIAAILAEQQARAAAINSERTARLDGDSALAVRVDELSVKIDSLPVFSSGFEEGNDYNQWVAGAASTLSAETTDVFIGAQAARISSTATAPSASGIPGGVIAPIPEGTSTAFSGKRIRVRVHAKQPATGGSAEFAVAYSTNDGDTSGWQSFTPDGTWQAFEFLYDVPAGGANTDYLSIWADTSGAGGELLVDAVTVEATASDIPEFTAAILAEQQARIDGDEALAAELTLLEAEANNNLQAAIAQEQAARASLQEAVATDIGSLTARVGDNESEISTIQMAQADAEVASALIRSLVDVQAAAVSAMVRTEEAARIEEDSAIASRVTTVEARIDDDISAAIQTEQAARVSADEALAVQITTAQSELGDDIAAVQQDLNSEVIRLDDRVDSNAQAITTAQSALEGDIATVQQDLNSEVSRLDGRVDSNAQALTTAQSALEGDIATVQQDLNSEVTRLDGRVDSTAQALTTAQSALGDDIATVQQDLNSEVTRLDGRVDSNAQAIITAQSALEGDIATVQQSFSSEVTRLDGRVDSNAQALTTAQSALEGDIATVQSDLNSEVSRLDGRVDATASDVSTVQSNVDDGLASVRSDMSTEVTRLDGRVDSTAQAITTAQSALEGDIASAQTEMRTYVEGDIIARNGTFATGDLDGWHVRNDGDVDVVPKDEGSSYNAVRTMPSRFAAHLVYPGGTVLTYLVGEDFTASGGENYVLQFGYAGGGSGLDIKLRCGFWWIDADGATARYDNIDVDVTSTGWRRSDPLTVTAPDDAVQGRVYFQARSGNANRVFVANVVARRSDATLGALYTAKVQTNGLIGGFGIYNDGTEVDAGFDVDRFWVGRTDNDKRKPFIIQDGVVYMDTALIRDASIQEGKIGPITVGKLRKPDGTPITTATGLLRADAIDANAIRVTRAMIDDAAINTLKLAGQAVTFPQAAFNGSRETISTAGGDRVSITGSFSGAPVMVLFGGSGEITDSSSSSTLRSCTLDMRLYRGSTEIFNSSAGFGGIATAVGLQKRSGDQGVGGSMVGMVIDNPSAGTRTYTLNCRKSFNGSARAQNFFILTIELKR